MKSEEDQHHVYDNNGAYSVADDMKHQMTESTRPACDDVVEGRRTDDEVNIVEISPRKSAPAEPGQKTRRSPRQFDIRELQQYDTAQFDNYLRQQDPEIQKHIHVLNKYIKFLCDQNETLYHHLEHAQLNSKAHEKDAHDFKKLKIAFDELQVEALKSVDTYQPTTDDVLNAGLTKLRGKVSPLVNLLCKTKTKLNPEEWLTKLLDNVYPGSFNFESIEFDLKDVQFQRQALRNVLWHFLEAKLFRSPLGSFPGDLGQDIKEAYVVLFPEPHKDRESARWRSITASKLALLADDASRKKQAEQLMEALNEMLVELGYDFERPDVQKKGQEMIDVAIFFASQIAQQRSILKLKFPSAEGGELEKQEDDALMTYLDEETEKEIPGKVLFISEPAFVKWGTGSGHQLDQWICLTKASVELVQ